MTAETAIGSLFSGYGGLDDGVLQVVGGRVVFHAEVAPAPAAILAHHYPDVPNLGDVTKVDWTTAPRVDVLTGGFPCQDVSLSGLRKGLHDGTRSGLWSEFARAIEALRPALVVIENVRGLLSATASRKEALAAHRIVEPDPWGLGDEHGGPALRALGAVLGDLADLGYDTDWQGILASDAGAPHRRFRVFIVARPADTGRHGRGRNTPTHDDDRSLAHGDDADGRGGALAANTNCDEPSGQHREQSRGTIATGSSDRTTTDAGGARLREHTGEPPAEEAGPIGGDIAASASGVRPDRNWGPYHPAVNRWERVTGRVAPAPTKPDGRGGSHRLAPEFVEWMMGLEPGHVTDPAIGLSHNAQLTALGNGVVPQQAALAVRTLLS